MADNNIKTQIEFTAKDGVSAPIKGMEKTFKGLGTAMTTIGALMTTGLLAKGFKAVVTAGMEAEKSNKLLENRLKILGITSKRTNIELQNMASSLQKLTGYDDETLKDTMTSIMTITGDYNSVLQATQVSADMARAMNMDLATASMLVGRAYNGNTEMLRRYGIELDKGAKGVSVLNDLSQKFGSTSKAYMNTMAGAVDNLKNSWNDFLEALSRNANIKNAVNELAQLLDKIGKAVAVTEERLKKQQEVLLKQIQTIEKALAKLPMLAVNKSLMDYYMSLKKELVGVDEQLNNINNSAVNVNDNVGKGLEENEEKLKYFIFGLEQTKETYDSLLNEVSKYYLAVGEGMGAVIMGMENAWGNMLNNVIGMFLDASKQKLAILATEQLFAGNIIGSALSLAGIAGLEAMKIGVSNMTGNGKSSSSNVSESSSSGSSRSSSTGFTSSSSQATAPSVNTGANTLNIFISNPSFLTKADFDKTIDMLFSTAQNNGWSVSLNNSYAVVGD